MGNAVQFGGWVAFGLAAFLAAGFLVTSLVEHERRAALVAAAVAATCLAALAALLVLDYEGRALVVTAVLGTAALAALLVIAPVERGTALRITGPRERVDERDAVFHRFYRLQPGTPEFERYYAEHPEMRRPDDVVRAQPALAAPGSHTYDPLTSPYQVACFGLIESMSRDLEWRPQPLGGGRAESTAADFTRRIKGFARYLGAAAVGCTRLDPAHVYSHIGRSPGEWGASIELDHPNAIAVTVEMSPEMVRLGPDSPTTTETAYRYLEVGTIAMLIARTINLLGYEARAHVDGNYRVMCVPIAAAAGLGELGRLGLLMTPDLGPRVRIAVVTTDLPIEHDAPIVFGVQDFCSFCKKCADICPSGSIDAGEKAEYAGVEKWQTRRDTCYHYWRHAGSDCALCVKVCPYAHPASPVHDAVRWLIRRNHAARRLALWADDLAYGRRPAATYPYPEWHAHGGQGR